MSSSWLGRAVATHDRASADAVRRSDRRGLSGLTATGCRSAQRPGPLPGSLESARGLEPRSRWSAGGRARSVLVGAEDARVGAAPADAPGSVQVDPSGWAGRGPRRGTPWSSWRLRSGPGPPSRSVAGTCSAARGSHPRPRVPSAAPDPSATAPTAASSAPRQRAVPRWRRPWTERGPLGLRGSWRHGHVAQDGHPTRPHCSNSMALRYRGAATTACRSTVRGPWRYLRIALDGVGFTATMAGSGAKWCRVGTGGEDAGQRAAKWGSVDRHRHPDSLQRHGARQ